MGFFNKYLMQGVQSERLQFRLVSPDDYATWLPFYDDPESTRFWKGLPEDPDRACREQFERIFERYEKGLGGMNALILKDSGMLLGMCGLLVQHIDGVEELEIGYSLLPGFRGMGYATEAATSAKNFAFDQGMTLSLISIIHVDNVPSQRVAVRNGMFLDKTTIYKKNPVCIYRINKEEVFSQFRKQ